MVGLPRPQSHTMLTNGSYRDRMLWGCPHRLPLFRCFLEATDPANQQNSVKLLAVPSGMFDLQYLAKFITFRI